MHTRTIDRWVSVAIARSQGVTLPAVELILVGEDYFVRDGHHRISVARAFGEEYIDAKIIVSVSIFPAFSSLIIEQSPIYVMWWQQPKCSNLLLFWRLINTGSKAAKSGLMKR
jgi:hypothetical protein